MHATTRPCQWLCCLFLTAALLLAGCDFNPGADRTGCDGGVEVLRTLPDTTLVADGEPLVQELEGDQPFFRHTAGEELAYDASDNDEPAFSVSTSVIGPSATTLQVVPTSVGTARIIVQAQDDCEKEARFAFDVTVVPGD